MRSASPPDHATEVRLLGESQIRHLLATLVQVDDSLGRIEALCTGKLSPFSPERADVDPQAGALIASAVGSLRRRMLEALERLEVTLPLPTTSARWSIETALNFAEIAFSELGPERMRAYGPLVPEAQLELERLVHALTALLERSIALLHEGDPARLAESLTRVDGPEGEVLRGLEQLSRARGLFGLRPLIAAAADRARSRTLDVGVFGRVSSGKSSLLNAVIGDSVLPVGAVPMSAVPVWIAQGEPAAHVVRIDGSSSVLRLERLGEVATEAGNPENLLGLRRIEVAVPGAIPGIRLLDTPGLGSLSTSGPAMALEQLPRCDLGLVLVPAAAPLGNEELALLRGLAVAGIPARLLLSKADLAPEPERAAVLSYLRAECARRLGAGAPVELSAVSTHEPPSIEDLRHTLRQTRASHEADRAGKLRKRLLQLLRLASRDLGGATATIDEDAGREELRQSAIERIRLRADTVARCSPRALQAAATATEVAWREGREAAPAAREAVERLVADFSLAIRGEVDALSGTAGAAGQWPQRAPVFEGNAIASLDLRAPRAIPRRLLRAAAAHRFAALEPSLQRSLAAYSSRMLAWAEGAVRAVWRESATAAETPSELAEELLPLMRLAECVGTAPPPSIGHAEGGGGSR